VVVIVKWQPVGHAVREGKGVSEINLKLKKIPEVEHAVVMTKNGAVINDTTYEGEVLGAYTQFLGRFADQVGAQFGVGELKSVVVEGKEHHMFLFDSKLQYLGVSAKSSVNVSALDSEIRRVLAQK
jgi:predicted regulator of Ras-like GTPase activity (Roadblock/LC7/MglB family)